MSLPAPAIETIPELTLQVARSAFPQGCECMLIRDQLGSIYQDQIFAELFSNRGKPAEAPWRLALITVLQFAENLSDRQAAHAVRSRLDWKYLLALELTDSGFHYSVLSKFRGRLVQGGLEQQLLETLIEILKAKQLLKAGGRQRTDSTHVLAAVRGLNRLESVGETLRALLNDLAIVAPHWLKPQIEAAWAERYAHRFETYRLPKEETAQVALAELIGADGFKLLSAIYADDAPGYLRELPSVKFTRQTWLQQYWFDEGQLKWRNLQNLPPSTLRSDSPYDPEAHYAAKRTTKWTGYKVHLTESCDENEVHLITHVQTTLSTLNDVNVTQATHQALLEKALAPKEHLVDAGYVDAELLVKSKSDYNVNLLGPVKLDSSWQAKAAQGFDNVNFMVNWQNKTVQCPQGKTSVSWTEIKERTGYASILVKFSRTDCRLCPVRQLCTKAENERRSIGLLPQADYEVLQTQRRQQITPEWKQTYQKRAGIEGTLSQAVRAFDLRSTRYIGLAKTRLQHLATATAINLARLTAWWEGRPQAATRTTHFMALAMAG